MRHILFAIFIEHMDTLRYVVSPTEPADEPDSSDDEELGESILETIEMEVGTLHLREHEVHPSRHRKKRRKKKEANKMDDEGKPN